jgi:hypothetical protein
MAGSYHREVSQTVDIFYIMSTVCGEYGEYGRVIKGANLKVVSLQESARVKTGAAPLPGQLGVVLTLECRDVEEWVA